MKLPICEKCGNKARYQDLGGFVTLMYSPLVYNKEGKPVGGGSNTRKLGIKCVNCGSIWKSHQTELEDAQGKQRTWELVEDLRSSDLESFL